MVPIRYGKSTALFSRLARSRPHTATNCCVCMLDLAWMKQSTAYADGFFRADPVVRYIVCGSSIRGDVSAKATVQRFMDVFKDHPRLLVRVHRVLLVCSLRL